MSTSNTFLTNYTSPTVLKRIQENLTTCTSFSFSVSFIKKAGLLLLEKDIEAALLRGCQGRIITSTYQNFTDIASLEIFLDWTKNFPNNFSCNLEFDSFPVQNSVHSFQGYHTKGYLFTFIDHNEIIIGSSNITRFALLRNIEWNLLQSVNKDSAIWQQVSNEFEQNWGKTKQLDRKIIQNYTQRLNFCIEQWDMDYELIPVSYKPNLMQRKALKELNRLRVMGKSKALAIAAAGSGKTFLAAFDARAFDAKRLLYIVHEKSILVTALETFEKVFGTDKSYNLYDGNPFVEEEGFLFSTNIMMSRDCKYFPVDYFDYIIIDECHHSVASTYKKIIEYFKPEFLLGLTATPERMDNQDVIKLFGENISFELRLRDAIINGLVVPFKYYGIRDRLIEYDFTKAQERKFIAQITDEEHCIFLYNEIEKYKPIGEKLKALAFCRSIQHAKQMAYVMGHENNRYHTAVLSGMDSVGERIATYNKLQDESAELEILFTVDILNEGVDIPAVNMVIFLRPTESSTIFIQQLGRGLRKYPGKEYVTVLDFIGNNYKRSVQIAFALGNLAGNFIMEKRLLQNLVKDGFKDIGLAQYGVEIRLDEWSKEEINKYLESENFNTLRYLKQDYLNFKNYIRCESYPNHIDFFNNDCAPDLLRFLNVKIQNKRAGSYYAFLEGIGEENIPCFDELQKNFLNDVSRYLPLVRPHEYLILQELLNGAQEKIMLIKKLVKIIKEKCCISQEDDNFIQSEADYYITQELEHAIEFLPSNMVLKPNSDNYFEIELRTNPIKKDQIFFSHIKDLLDYGLTEYYATYRGIPYFEKFKLWNSYMKDLVLLKLLMNPKHNQNGTYYYEKNVVIFASINKDKSIQDRLNYKDKFILPNQFQWESMTNISKTDLKKIRESNNVLLFIRKMENDHGIPLPYTFVGKGNFIKSTEFGPSETGTYIYQILLDKELPDYLQYDFELSVALQ